MVKLIKIFMAMMLGAMIITPSFGASPEQRLSLLERKFKGLSGVTLQMDSIRRENRQLRGDVEVLNHEISELKKRQRQLYLDLDSRVSAGATTARVPRGAIAPTPQSRQSAPAIDSDKNEQKIYQEAFASLMQRRYKASITGFTRFLKNFPNGRYADNAQYWLAEAQSALQQYDKALKSFSVVINKYPASSKVADALVKSGFIYYDKKNWKKSRQFLTRVMNQHGSTTAYRLAKKRLDKMKSEGH